ncbi:MAG: hypothetical protein K2X39_04015, partial [Silvanigrellaceae bacterium]|nr:hypothetical protein [Silvanigrellaceae bacterium]
GDFVLSGGELAALCIIDSVSRFVPGVLGNALSSAIDSFEDGLLEAPQYTKPEDFESNKVPDVLRSGDHKKIKQYHRIEQIKKTAMLRPDLLPKIWDKLSPEEKKIITLVSLK